MTKPKSSTDAIIAAARECVGTKFSHQGRIPGQRIDCVGVIMHVVRKNGLTWADGSSAGQEFVYGRELAKTELMDICRSKLIEKPIAQLAAGDVVVLFGPAISGHVAVVGESEGTLTLIHALNRYRHECVEHNLADHWRRYIVGCFAFPEPQVTDHARLAITVGFTILGAALGSIILPGGGTMLGAEIGAMVGGVLGSLLFQPHMEGPHLLDGRTTSTTYGTPIARGWGLAGIGGMVIDDGNLVEHRHEDGGSGAPTVVTYTYSVTMALAFGKGPGTIRRVWADGKLIYDATGVSDTSSSQGWVMRTYRGTETQTADSALEALHGVGNVPGYRGIMYLVLDDVPLDNFGQHRPSIFKAEVAFDGKLSTSLSAIVVDLLADCGFASTEYEVDLLAGVVDGYTLAQLATARQALQPLAQAFFFDAVESDFKLKFKSRGVPTPGVVGPINTSDGLNVSAIRVFNHYVYVSGDRLELLDGITDSIFKSITGPGYGSYASSSLFVDPDGYFYMGEGGGASYAAPWYRYDPTARPTIKKTATYGESGFGFGNTIGELPPSVFGAGVAFYTAAGKKIAVVGFGSIAEVGIIDLSEGYPLNKDTAHTGPLRWTPANGSSAFGSASGPAVDADGLVWVLVRNGANFKLTSFGPFDGLSYVTDTDGYVHADVPESSYDLGNLGIIPWSGPLYDPELNALLMSFNSGDTQAWSLYTHDWIPSLTGSFSLGVFSAIDGGYFVVLGASHTLLIIKASDLSIFETITITDGGGNVYGIPGNEALGLGFDRAMNAIYVIATNHQVYHLTVGGALAEAGAEIAENDLLPESNDKPTRVTETRIQEAELPKRVGVRYSCTERNYDPDTQFAFRHNTVIAVDEVELQVPITSNVNRARQIADRQLYSAWATRGQQSFKALPKSILFDPLDIGHLNYKGLAFPVRLLKQTVGADGSIEWMAQNNENASGVHYTRSTSDPGAQAPDDSVLLVLALTDLFILDTPLLRDADANDAIAGAYWAVKPHSADSWAGARVFSSPDNVDFSTTLGSSANQPTYGTVASALAQHPTQDFWNRDDTNSFTVTVGHGSFASVTDADIQNGKNWIILGSEVLGVRDWVDNGDGTFTGSKLYRGLRGTEWACGTHGSSETLVAIDFQSLQHAQSDVNLIGVTRYYRAVTFYATLDSASSTSHALQGRDLKPYAPYQIAADQAASGDIQVTWTRRTRYGGKWNGWTQGLSIVPLNEAYEAYEIDIMGGSPLVVKRTLTSNTPDVWYSKEDQITDFGSQQSSIHARVYQMSAVVGRGYVGEKTVASFAGSVGNQPAGGLFTELTVSGTINGSNTAFSLNRSVNLLAVFLDGQKVNSADVTFTPGTSSFTLATAPTTGAHLEAWGA